MATERRAELEIATKLTGTEKGVEQFDKLTGSAERLGAVSGEVAGDLNRAADAFDGVAAAEQKTEEASRDAAIALESVGEAALESSAQSVSAARGAAQALEGVETAARDEAQAVRDTGRAAAEAGAETTDALDQVARAQDRATQGAEELGDTTREAADEGRSAVQKLADSYVELADRASTSDLNLEVQRAGIEAIADELQDLVRENVQMGDSGRDAANAFGEALIQVRARLADVNARIRDQIANLRENEATATATFGTIHGAALSFERAATGAINDVNAAWKSFNEEQKLTPKQVNEVAQSVAALKAVIADLRATGQPISPAQIAITQQLEGELAKLTAQSNALTNASKDNAVGLQESATQVAGLATTIQGLISSASGGTTAIANFFGRAAQGATNFERLKDVLAAVATQQLGASKSASGLATQVLAVVAAAYAGISVGTRLASVNAENAESLKDFHILAEPAIAAQKSLTDGWDGIQHAAQNVLADFYELLRVQDLGLGPSQNALTERTKELTGAVDSQDRLVARLTNSMLQLVLAFRSGRTGAELYTAAVRDGVKWNDAARIAINDNADVLKFYNDSLRAGTEGQRLWKEALDKAAGSEFYLAKIVRDHRDEMQAAVNAQVALTAAREQEDSVLKGLRTQLDRLDRLLASAGDNSAALVAVAAQLAETAKSTRGLSDAEEERLRIITDLIARGADMTETEKRIVNTLNAQIRAGQGASAALNTLLRLQISFEQATSGSNEKLAVAFTVLSTLTRQWDVHSRQISRAIADTQALLARTDNLTEAQRRQYQGTLDGLLAVEQARARAAQLETQRTITLKTAEDDLTNRIMATSRAIRERLTDLESLIPASAEYGGTVRDLAGQLQQVIDNTVTLVGTDRERLQLIIDIAMKGGELTAAQQQLALSLIASAKGGEQFSTALSNIVRIEADLDQAVGGTTKKLGDAVTALKLFTGAWETNSIAVRTAAGELENILGKTDGLTEAQRKLYEAIIEGVKNVDELTRSKRDLEKAQIKLLDLGDRMTAEQYREYEANQQQLYTIQRQIEATKGLVAERTQEITVLKGTAAAATSAATATNTATAANQAAQQQLGATKTSADAANESMRVVVQTMEDGSRKIVQVADAAQKVNTNLMATGATATTTAGAVSAANQRWLDNADAIEELERKLGGVQMQLRAINELADNTPGKLERLAGAMNELAAASERASGERNAQPPQR